MEAITQTNTKVYRQRDRGIAIFVATIAIAAMVVDHLLGEDPGLEDPPMFAIACAVTLGLCALVFGRIVPRAQAANREARDGLILGAVAIVPGIATLWLGPPFVLAGGGLALGLRAWSVRDRRGVAAVALAVLMLGFGTIAYSVQLVDKLG